MSRPVSAASPANSLLVSKRWWPGALAAVWLLACSDQATPSADSPAPGPSMPGAATDPETPSDPGASADPSGTPGDPTTAPAAGDPTNEGNESNAGGAPALDPAAAGSSGVAAGGADNAGGAPGAAGATGAPEVIDPDPGALLGSLTRPQLAATAAPNFDVLTYLASAGNVTTGLVRDDWDPTAGVGDVSTFTADFRVAASGGTHTTVQAAITAAVSAGGSARRFIEVAAGTYREVVCVPNAAPPITLY
ncbi:MAG TPA: hypothetical protein VMG12_15805, partial [Polyangiaceae bacterium]|nr:hypothetical protein [Polyangiaceae bacterium]